MELELGYDIPARIGMAEADVATPALILDLDVFEANLARAQADCDAMGVALRPHGKMHRCPDVALAQMAAGAVGICAQKVSEAEAFVRGGVSDVMITNQVVGAERAARVAALSRRARVIACVDDARNVVELSAAAKAERAELEVVVELECGQGRCGVPLDRLTELAHVVAEAEGLRFAGLQAYHGGAQQIAAAPARSAAIAETARITRAGIDALTAAGLPPEIVGGAGTGTYPYEGASGLWTEVQCGSYAFMDASYSGVADPDGGAWRFQQACYVLTTVMSTAPGRAVCDAGHKTVAIDSGLPRVAERSDLAYTNASDEHGVIDDPEGTLPWGGKLRLVPGHCDPTCNLHDWIVGLRSGRVEALWPVSARGKSY